MSDPYDYHKYGAKPVRRWGPFWRRIPWGEWADGRTRFWDGRRARRIRREVNDLGDERWYVEHYSTDGEFAGWFKDFPPEYDREHGWRRWFETHEDCLAHIRATSWVAA